MDSKKKTVIVENSSVITLTSQNFKDTISFGVVMVDFWASWCGPCRKQSAIINETVDELPSGVIIGKVNVDEEKALAEEFNISSIPSWLVFKDGEKISSMTGVQSKEQLIKIASASK
ncbi:MAG: thioredoxin [Lentisphaerae bacterium]|nr:thioredoxin [Lentisphaerota bacterium]